jgi:predicted TPR repeat methyltransferase
MKYNKHSILQKKHDGWAASYDKDTRSDGWCAPDVLTRHLIAILNLDKPLKIIDLAVGTGEASKVFLEMGHQVIGLDISYNMLQEAKKKYPSFNRLEYYDLNKHLSAPGITKESADVIICCGALHYSTHLELTLIDIISYLKKDGHLAFTYIPKQKLTFSNETKCYKKDIIEKTISQLGLTTILDKRFIAYFRNNDKNAPIFYGLIIARKKK